MKKIWALLLSVLLLVSVLCMGAIPANAAVTGTFVDEIVDGFTHPEIVEYTAEGTTEIGTQGHRMSFENNPDLGATLLLKQDNDRDPSHTEYITYKMAKNIAGFEFSVMCCAGLGDPLEDLTVYISKTGAEGSWAQVKTQATKYVFDESIYPSWHEAYWFNSKLMNAQKIPTGYKYLKIQFNPCTDAGDVPWNVAIDTVTVYMGSNVAAPVIPEEDTFLTWEEINNQEESTTDPSDTESTTPSTDSTTPSDQPTTPSNPAVIIGDVNNDGKINVRDLGMLQQHINGWDVGIYLAAADITGEGKVNVRDLGILQQYLNGWDVTLGGGSQPTAPSEPEDPTTTPTAPSTQPTATTPPTEPSTTPTATTPPTEPPVVVPKVDMPSAGYDVDGKSRIMVSSSDLRVVNGNIEASFTFVNVSKDYGREWIIPEYSEIDYACYDADGAQVSTGTLMLGALEYRDAVTCKITLLEGAVRVVFTDHNLEYWTPWA